MNDDDKFRLLDRFAAYLVERGISRPVPEAEIYRFLESNR